MNTHRLPSVLVTLFASLLVFNTAHAQREGAKPKPDLANVPYGPHERNVLDFWKAKSDMLTPLVVYIHGGGFRADDKGSVSPSLLNLFDQGIHHITFGIKLKEMMEPPGIECTIRHADEKMNSAEETNDFFVKHLVGTK